MLAWTRSMKDQDLQLLQRDITRMPSGRWSRFPPALRAAVQGADATGTGAVHLSEEERSGALCGVRTGRREDELLNRREHLDHPDAVQVSALVKGKTEGYSGEQRRV